MQEHVTAIVKAMRTLSPAEAFVESRRLEIACSDDKDYHPQSVDSATDRTRLRCLAGHPEKLIATEDRRITSVEEGVSHD